MNDVKNIVFKHCNFLKFADDLKYYTYLYIRTMIMC